MRAKSARSTRKYTMERMRAKFLGGVRLVIRMNQGGDVDVNVCLHAMWIKGGGRGSKRRVHTCVSGTLIICVASRTGFKGGNEIQAASTRHQATAHESDVTIGRNTDRKYHR